jgi:hypothetical protein
MNIWFDVHFVFSNGTAEGKLSKENMWQKNYGSQAQ